MAAVYFRNNNNNNNNYYYYYYYYRKRPTHRTDTDIVGYSSKRCTHKA